MWYQISVFIWRDNNCDLIIYIFGFPYRFVRFPEKISLTSKKILSLLFLCREIRWNSWEIQLKQVLQYWALQVACSRRQFAGPRSAQKAEIDSDDDDDEGRPSDFWSLQAKRRFVLDDSWKSRDKSSRQLALRQSDGIASRWDLGNTL